MFSCCTDPAKELVNRLHKTNQKRAHKAL